MAFIPNPDKLPIIDHINRIRYDNRPSNLRWTNNKGNAANRMAKSSPACSRGINQYTISGELVQSWKCVLDAVKSLSDDKTKWQGTTCRIRMVCNGQRKSVSGYKWKWQDEPKEPDLLEGEEWKTLQYYKEVVVNLQISSEGRIKMPSGNILRGHLVTKYLAVYLDSLGHKAYVHVLVALAFHSNPENKQTVDHINRNKTDNRATNLQWATHTEQANNRQPRSRSYTRPIIGVDNDGKETKYESIKAAECALDLRNGAIRDYLYRHKDTPKTKCKWYYV